MIGQIKIFLLLTSLIFLFLVIVNGIVSMLLPLEYNFHHTHWILGRLTGLYEYDFLVDMLLVSFAAALVILIYFMTR